MKESQLQKFTNSDIGEIKGFIGKDGEPWFLAGQVCRCLGIKNSRDAISKVKERYNIAGLKGVGTNYTLIETAGGKQKTQVISEPFLYELIFSSRKQKAIKFRTWVTSEVLPSIRKHGEYRMEGKLIRREMADVICDSGENSRMHGHGIVNFTKLVNKSLGLDAKNDRDSLPDDLLKKIAKREALISALVDEGMEYNQVKELIEAMP